jgi:hypothetical protein
MLDLIKSLLLALVKSIVWSVGAMIWLIGALIWVASAMVGALAAAFTTRN